MLYQVVNAGKPLVDMQGLTVFLGGMSKRTGKDWRKDFFHTFEKYNVTFVNPKMKNFPDPDVNPGEHARQVQWEREALGKCDVAIFWLGEGLQNQASRVEIGYAIGTGKTVFIGAEDGFLGMEHLTAFGGLTLSQSLEGLMARLQSEYNSRQK